MHFISRNDRLLDPVETEFNKILYTLEVSAYRENELDKVIGVCINSREDERHAALFSRTVAKLGFEDLATNLSVFLSLVIAYQDNPTFMTPSGDFFAMAVLKHYQKNHWPIPLHQAALDDSTEVHKNMKLSNEEVLKSWNIVETLNDALNFIQREYQPKNNWRLKLADDIRHFLDKKARAFEWYGFNQDILQMIAHILEVADVNNQSVIQDGCAGLGLLSLQLPLHNDVHPELRLETTTPIFQQITMQIAQIQGLKRIVRCHTNNPLSTTELKLAAKQADVILSFPKMPYVLNRVERSIVQPFLKIGRYEILPGYASDALWVQYAWHHLKDGGIAFLAVQEGFLRRGGYDQNVRKYLIDRSAVKLVITLNANQARQSQYNQVYLLMLVKNSACGHVNSDALFDNEGVMFIDFRETQRLYDRKGTSLLNLTTLPFWDDEKYKQMTDHFNLGSVRIFKSNDEIVMNNCNLLIGNYQDKPGQNDFPNLAQATRHYNESAKHLEQCFEELDVVLKKFKII